MHLSQLFNLDQIIMQGAGSLSNRENSHKLQDWDSVTSTQEFHKIEYINPILFMYACKRRLVPILIVQYTRYAQIPRTWLHGD